MFHKPVVSLALNHRLVAAKPPACLRVVTSAGGSLCGMPATFNFTPLLPPNFKVCPSVLIARPFESLDVLGCSVRDPRVPVPGARRFHSHRRQGGRRLKNWGWDSLPNGQRCWCAAWEVRIPSFHLLGEDRWFAVVSGGMRRGCFFPSPNLARRASAATIQLRWHQTTRPNDAFTISKKEVDGVRKSTNLVSDRSA